MWARDKAVDKKTDSAEVSAILLPPLRGRVGERENGEDKKRFQLPNQALYHGKGNDAPFSVRMLLRPAI